MEIEEDETNHKHLLPDNIKHSIILHKMDGRKSDKQIGRDIFSVYGRRIGNSTVKTLWNKYQKTHSLANDWSMKGRSKLLNQEDDEMLIQAVRENRLSSAKDLKNNLELPVSRETLNRELLSLGYKSYKAPAKPVLEPDHMLERYRFADGHQSWGMAQWSRVIFTDESAFRLINPNSRISVRRLEEERFEPFAIQSCVPFSGMVMV